MSLRRHATTLLLLGLVIATGAVVLVVDRGAVTTNEAELRRGNLFAAWRADEVTELSITTGGRAARLTRKAGSGEGGPGLWTIAMGGATYPGEEQAIDDFLGKLEFAMSERRVAEASIDREAFGLASPRIAIEVTMGALRDRLTVGGEAPKPQGGAYAEVEGRGVYVITAQLLSALDVDPATFRSRKLVPYISNDLAALELSGEGGERRLVRAPWGGGRGSGFRFGDGTPPSSALGPLAGTRVNAASLDLVLAALGAMQAEGFLADAEADAAAKPQVTIRLTPKDSSLPRGELAIGGECPGRADHVVAIRRSPDRASACVARATVDPLTAPVDGFADRKLIGAPLDEVTEVKLVEGASELEIARSGTGFHERSPRERDVPADVGRAFVDAILRTEVTRFVTGDLAALGLSPPRATVRVASFGEAPVDAGGDRVETVEIGTEQGGVVYARRLEDGAVGELPAGALRNLLPDDLALRDRAIVGERAVRVRAIRIDDRGDDPKTLSLARDQDDDFALLEPKGEGFAADQELAAAAAEAVGSLTAESWVAARDDGTHELEKPRLVVEAQIGDEGGDGGARRTLRILLGGPALGGSYAKVESDPAVFVAPRAFEAAVTLWLLDRSGPSVDVEHVTRVTLSATGGRGLTVERGGDKPDSPWRVAGAGGGARAAAVRDALADLKAEAVIALGRPKKAFGLEPAALAIVIERDGGDEPVRLTIGAGDTFRGTRVYYVRRAGIDATYAVAQAKIQPLLDAAR